MYLTVHPAGWMGAEIGHQPFLPFFPFCKDKAFLTLGGTKVWTGLQEGTTWGKSWASPQTSKCRLVGLPESFTSNSPGSTFKSILKVHSS